VCVAPLRLFNDAPRVGTSLLEHTVGTSLLEHTVGTSLVEHVWDVLNKRSTFNAFKLPRGAQEGKQTRAFSSAPPPFSRAATRVLAPCTGCQEDMCLFKP